MNSLFQITKRVYRRHTTTANKWIYPNKNIAVFVDVLTVFVIKLICLIVNNAIIKYATSIAMRVYFVTPCNKSLI